MTVLRPVKTNTGGGSPPDRSPVFSHILKGKREGVYRPTLCKCDLIYILPTLCHILSAVVRSWPPPLTSTLHSCTAPAWSESGHRHTFIPAVVVANLSCVLKVLKRKKDSGFFFYFFFLNGGWTAAQDFRTCEMGTVSDAGTISQSHAEWSTDIQYMFYKIYRTCCRLARSDRWCRCCHFLPGWIPELGWVDTL